MLAKHLEGRFYFFYNSLHYEIWLLDTYIPTVWIEIFKYQVAQNFSNFCDVFTKINPQNYMGIF